MGQDPVGRPSNAPRDRSSDHIPPIPVSPGDVIEVGSRDYRFGEGDVTLRITAVEGLIWVGGGEAGEWWAQLWGRTVYGGGVEGRVHPVSVRLRALGSARRPGGVPRSALNYTQECR